MKKEFKKSFYISQIIMDYKNIITLLGILKSNQLKIGTVESMTGGAIISALTNIPGYSDFIYGGIVSYNMSAKEELLSAVTTDVYTKEYSKKMCQDLFDKSSVDIVVSITGKNDIEDDCSYKYNSAIGIRIDGDICYKTYYKEKYDKELNDLDMFKRREVINIEIVNDIVSNLIDCLQQIV